MRLPDILRTTIFRTALVASAGFGATTLLIFVIIYHQMYSFHTAAIQRFLGHEADAIAQEAPADALREVAARYSPGLHRQTMAGFFNADGAHITGNLLAIPPDLPADGRSHRVTALMDDGKTPHDGVFLAQLRTLPDGRQLLVARNEEEWDGFLQRTEKTMFLALLPSVLVGLGVGVVASRRTLDRLERVNETMQRIVKGNLRERLTEDGTGDAFGHLAASVNRMLDELSRLVEELQSVGDAMAHDLRTPLARVRTQLEGARHRARTHEELQAAVDTAITDLDRTFDIITALLRIAQIDGSVRQGGFSEVDVPELLREAVELYEPIAESRGMRLNLSAPARLEVVGDRDLLFEAVTNLLDNAIKFSPPGSAVDISAGKRAEGPWLAVRDRGPGIPQAEQKNMLQRFHRGHAARAVPGHGLGLSLVAAIVRLHCFHLEMDDARPGLIVQLRAWEAAEA